MARNKKLNALTFTNSSNEEVVLYEAAYIQLRGDAHWNQARDTTDWLFWVLAEFLHDLRR